jgi:hypothetical protein
VRTVVPEDRRHVRYQQGRAVEPVVAQELRSLASRYAAAVDRRDRDLLLSVFHADATLTVVRHGTEARPSQMRGHAEIGRVVDLLGAYTHTFHFLGQCDYVRDDAGASGEVACIAHHHWTDDVDVDVDVDLDLDLDHVMYIRYGDEYLPGDDGCWRIASRTVAVDWSETRVIDTPGRSAR